MLSEFRIVSLCGSAGALDSYVEIIAQMPVDSGTVFVILTHRRAGQPCWLVPILSRNTAMQVHEIADGMIFEPNHVYVIPAGQDLRMDGDTFCLTPMSKMEGWPDSFDIYLKSVANSAQYKAVTVILSGMAGDGSAAMDALRLGGGVNYAQAGAPMPSMPDSAIRTGSIDYVGSAEEIATAILVLFSKH